MYADLQNTVQQLFTELGQEVTLTRTVTVGGSFSPSTGMDSAPQTYTFKVLTVFVGVKFSWGMLRASHNFPIQEGDAIALVSPKGGTFVSPPAFHFPNQEVVPEQNDVIDGWTILNVEEVNPAGTVVLYKCHVRKQ